MVAAALRTLHQLLSLAASIPDDEAAPLLALLKSYIFFDLDRPLALQEAPHPGRWSGSHGTAPTSYDPLQVSFVESGQKRRPGSEPRVLGLISPSPWLVQRHMPERLSAVPETPTVAPQAAEGSKAIGTPASAPPAPGVTLRYRAPALRRSAAADVARQQQQQPQPPQQHGPPPAPSAMRGGRPRRRKGRPSAAEDKGASESELSDAGPQGHPAKKYARRGCAGASPLPHPTQRKALAGIPSPA
jgi:hypothetical protein